VLYCPRAPHLVYWPFPLPLCLVSPWLSPLPLVCVFPQSRDATELLPPLAGSSGFSPLPCYQASQALSPQYYTQICRPLSLSQLRFLPSRVRFIAPSGNDRSQDRRTSPGKIASPPHIPSSFTSVRFTGYRDSLWYACSSSSPLPFSWFAVRYVHGFCLMLPPDTPSLGMPLPCWRCPSVR